MFTITETIHHGDYRSVTTTDVERIDAATIGTVFAASPYTYNPPRPELAEKIAADLKAGREVSHGWSRFTATKIEKPATIDDADYNLWILTVDWFHEGQIGTWVFATEAELEAHLMDLAADDWASAGQLEVDVWWDGDGDPSDDAIGQHFLDSHGVNFDTYLNPHHTARPPALYVPPTTDDDGDTMPATIACPACGGTSIYEVDRAVRWTELEYGADDDPRRVTVTYGEDGDYESDHLRCANDPTCGVELSYPANWSRVLREA
jgi:hypothetical protein